MLCETSDIMGWKSRWWAVPLLLQDLRSLSSLKTIPLSTWEYLVFDKRWWMALDKLERWQTGFCVGISSGKCCLALWHIIELIQRLLNRVKDWAIEVVSGKVSFRLLPLFQTKKTCASEYLNLFEIRTSTYSAYDTLVGISEGFSVGCLPSQILLWRNTI